MDTLEMIEIITDATPRERVAVLVALKDSVLKDRLNDEIYASQILADALTQTGEIVDQETRTAVSSRLESLIAEIVDLFGWSCHPMDLERRLDTLQSDIQPSGKTRPHASNADSTDVRNRILIMEDDAMLRVSMVKGLSKIVNQARIFSVALQKDAEREIQNRGSKYALALIGLGHPDDEDDPGLIQLCHENGIVPVVISSYFDAYNRIPTQYILSKPVALESLRGTVLSILETV